MKGDTSAKRIILIVVLTVLAFPWLFQLLTFRGNLFPDGPQLESTKIFFEIKTLQRLIQQHMNATGEWPESQSEISPGLDISSIQEFDLSVYGQITSRINQQAKTPEFRDQTVVFRQGITWMCVPELTTLPEEHTPKHCGGSMVSIIKSTPSTGYFYFLAVLAVTGIVIGVLFFHPVIRTLRRRELSLDKQNLTDLAKLAVLCRFSGLRDQVIEANQLNPRSWQKITGFVALNPRLKINWLARSLGLASHHSVNATTHRCQLDEDVPLNVQAIHWYVPAKSSSITRIISHLKNLKEDHIPVMIWAEDPGLNQQLQLNRSRIKGLRLIPNLQQMTRLLVPSMATDCLLDLLVRELPVNLLSPFQGTGGLVKASQFYGRTHMLSTLQNNPNSCFLLVGGRQMGKTSILKAHARTQRQAVDRHCCYVSLSDHRLLPRLAYHLQISEYRDLTDLLQQHHQQHPQQKLTLLIDEADRFIADQARQDFRLLAEIRACAEQGLAQVVLAGFWDLYASAVLDYHSPVRNFAEVLTVGPLKQQPARRLLAEPMALLKQQFSSTQLVDEVVRLCGQRANLINLIGSQLTRQLAEHPQVINQQLIQQALDSQVVHDALQGWSNLSKDALECWLDRVVVYLTFIHTSVNLARVITQLSSQHIRTNPEALKQSFSRLRLAHILRKDGTDFVFAVPLFATQFSPEEATELLQQETNTYPG